MNHKTGKRVLLLGAVLAALLLLSCWYALTYNEGRLVLPTDFSSYTFRVQDLPMVLSLALVTLYVLGLCIGLARHILRRRQAEKTARFTRTLNPKLGFLGFLGFFGFLGFWSYPAHQDITPFLFFGFFGFFGFFYEGKLSHTFMDERFRENQMRAELTALRLGYGILFLAAVVLGSGRLLGSLEYTLIALLCVLGLVLGLVLFLSQYLLYRYDHDDSQE